MANPHKMNEAVASDSRMKQSLDGVGGSSKSGHLRMRRRCDPQISRGIALPNNARCEQVRQQSNEAGTDANGSVASSFNCIKRIDSALHELSETRHTRLLNNRHHPSGCGLDSDRFIGLSSSCDIGVWRSMERRVSACDGVIIDRVYLRYVDEKQASSRSFCGYSRKRHVGTFDAAVCLVMRGGTACPASARGG